MLMGEEEKGGGKRKVDGRERRWEGLWSFEGRGTEVGGARYMHIA